MRLTAERLQQEHGPVLSQTRPPVGDLAMPAFCGPIRWPPDTTGTPLESLEAIDRLQITEGGMDEMRTLLGAVVALTLVAGAPFLADAGKAEDATLTTKVKTKLTADRAKNLVSVNVDTKDGVVHLKGTVPNEQAKAEAERLAKDTEGVVSVTNDLKVAPPKK